MTEVILIIHLLICLALIGVVLLQRSEGGALGIGGGGGGGGNLFSARGAANALTRTTAILAVAFFVTSISLTILARRQATPTSVFDNATTNQQPTTGDDDGSKNGSSVLPKLPETPKSTDPQVPTGN